MKPHHWIVFGGSVVYAVLLVFSWNQADAQVDPCAGVAKPATVKTIVIEPNPSRYEGPPCFEGETCATPPDWDDREFLPDGSARYVFSNVGELRAVLKDGKWESEVLEMLPAPAPACWAWQWRPM